MIFFTKEVNKLTPRGSGGVIGGFFFERDLFPTTDNAGSRAAPAATSPRCSTCSCPIRTRVFSDERIEVGRARRHARHARPRVPASDQRRPPPLREHTSDDFEEVWLNEGLSHIAEELLYYHVGGSRRARTSTSTQLRQSQATVDAFNKYQGDNFGRFEIFLAKPSQTSVYADNDSLETRGATWNLLRYLADHRGSSDGDTWSQLVNTRDTGRTNLVERVRRRLHDADSRLGDVGVRRRRRRRDRRALPRAELEHARHLPALWSTAAASRSASIRSSVVPLSDARRRICRSTRAARRTCASPCRRTARRRSTGRRADCPVSPFVQFTVVRTK